MTALDSTDPISNELTQKRVTVISKQVCQHRWDKSVFGTRTIYPQNICIDEQTSVSACKVSLFDHRCTRALVSWRQIILIAKLHSSG